VCVILLQLLTTGLVGMLTSRGRRLRHSVGALRQRLCDGAVMACCATWHRHRLTATAMAQDALHSIVTTRHAFPQLAHHDVYFPSPCV
jgi:hypothetical protein